MTITDTPLSGEAIIEEGAATERFHALLESYERALNELSPPSYTVATVPDATKSETRLIYVSDESGGKTLAFSNGVNWLRVQDLAIIS